MTLFMVLFTQMVQAQIGSGDNYLVYMKEGNSMVASNANGVYFYDDHGPSHASNGNINYWDRWYSVNQHYTYVFRPKKEGDKIKVTFKKFNAYEWSDSHNNNCHNIGEFSLRINDDVLKVYNSDGAVAANLIAELTGTVVDEFTLIADGAMTFEFTSNEQYREEGWGAQVTAVSSMTVQKPLIQRSTCSDDILLIPTIPGATMYYTTDGTDPTVPSKDMLSAGTLYTGPIEWPVGGNITIKAIAVLGDQESDVISKTFEDPDDRMPSMQNNAPTLAMVAGTNTVRITCPAVPEGLNETFYVAYTTDGSEPSYNNGNKVFFVPGSSYNYPESLGITVHASTYEFEVTTPGTKVRAKTFGYSCTNLISPEAAPLTITTVLVDSPSITFTTTNTTTGAGQATINDIMSGATVHYTTDGSTPSPSNGSAYSGAFAVNPGQTVKAIAHIEGTGYSDSPVVTDTYMPEGGNGTYGGVVLLDDREPHTWSYYSDADQPIHSLKPADVKITYFGNSPASRTTMTNASENGDNPTSFSATATGVAVNVGEAGDQFIYLKTLEAANEDGSGNYPYTMIPNPFQVRPTFETQQVTTSTVYISGTSYGNSGVIRVTYVDANGQTQTWERTGNGTSDTGTVTVLNGSTLTVFAQGRTGGMGNRQYSTVTARLNNSTGTVIASVTCNNTNHTNGTSNSGTVGTVSNDKYRGFYAWRIKSLSSGLTITGKSVGDIVYADEQITFETSKEEGNEVEFEALWAQAYVTTCSSNNGLSAAIASSSLNANVSYERNFVVVTGGTQTTDINNVSQKPVTISGLYPDGTGTMSSSTYLGNMFTANKNTKLENIYMRDGAATTDGYRYSYYLIIRVGNTYLYYTGTTWNNYYYYAQTYTMDFSIADDPNYDWQNYLYNTGQTATYNGNTYDVLYYFTNKTSITISNASAVYCANANDLIFGRGIMSVNSGDLCVKYVKGLNSNATSPNYTMRLESGVFDIVSMIDGYNGNESSLTISGTPKVSLVLGNDYDRASEKYQNGSMTISSNLDVKTAVAVGRGATIGSASMMGEETFKTWVKSGKIGSSHDMSNYNADFTETIYMSSHGGSTYTGYRKLFIEGGEISGVAGGMDQCYTSTTTHETNKSLTIRMTNGHVRSAIYGGAAQVPAGGDKEIIVTGGVVTGWIGAGCNGTADYDGQTYGEGFIYFGGDAISGGNGSSNLTNGVQGGVIFGAGAGRATSTTTGEMTFGTNVVIADECNVEHNVYGGGNYGYAVDHSNVYVLGGTVQGNVFGGANQKQGPVVNVALKNGTVSGNIYGGSNALGAINGLATINVSGGTASNVFGGGYGASTSMAAGTSVNISGGTINNNIYGGGELGTVTSVGTQVNVEGGSIGGNVFGAGKGATDQTALITGKTEVNITGGSITKSIYGGGEVGNVNNGTDLASTVTVNGAVTINENVFGGGMEGFTTGKVVVNLFQGNIRGHLFGGALGKQGSVYVGGQKTVNMTGGHVFGNVYGGSRNANDANVLTGYSTTEQATTCEINMSAGKIDQNLYGAGYFGHTYGSVNVYIGAEAISSAPNHTAVDENINYSREGGLVIEGTVFAGSDWGDFSGDFGPSTVSGMSNIYVDGTGYNTTSNSTAAANYMKAGVSILGCGTSNDAGKTGRTLIVKNYGTDVADAGNTANPFSTATRQLLSIQRFKEVIFDNAHLLLTGQGKVNSLNVTEKYGLYEDWTVYLSNGSTMVTNMPCSQIKSFQSVTCDNTYAATPSFNAVAINGLGELGSATDNKIRVNGGSYIEVKYEADGVTTPYGELKGWAHMMSSINDQEATCAYARPKQSQEAGNKIPAGEDNPNDGGFVSYDGIYNQYTAEGALVATGNQAQIRYENHTPNMTKDDSQYFRIWRYGGNHTNLEAVLDAHATGEAGYRTVDFTVTLPPFRSSSHYYRFETTGEAPNRNTATEYGSDVLTFNMAAYNTTLDTDGVHGTPADNGYMYYQNGQQLNQTAGDCPGKTDIDNNPDVNYGLVIMPNTSSAVAGSNYIICDAADNYLAELVKPFTCRDNTQAPEFTFRLTYNNELSSNMTWDPMKVKLVQCDANGNITDYVTIDLIIVTSTTITQDFNTKVYAVMDGKGSLKDTYISKIILPTYDVQTGGENSTFKITKVTFTPDVAVGSGTVTNNAISADSYNVNSFGLAIEAADTYDKTNVWFSTGGRIDVAASASPVGKEVGKESGRNEVGIDVILFYSGLAQVTEETRMGIVAIEIEFDNYKDGDTNHKGKLTVMVEIYRLGAGENYYVDGVHGVDAKGYGKNPDKPAATINYIFNRCEYRPGGNIFVVNTVTVAKPETWNGARFNSVTLYRYPGVHKLSTGEYGDPSTNPAFTGKLVEVSNELTLRGIVMDGMYAEATATSHDNTQNLYPSVHGCNFNGQSVASLINVADGGRVNLKDGVVLQNNYNTTATATEMSSPGGALSVQYGGTARMNENAQITANINGVAGGVWVDGTLIVSDHVQIFNNKMGTESTSRQSNVWLTEATDDQAKANVHYKVIQIGTASTTDEYGPIENDVKIGVDKEDWGNTIDGFMPVVYAEDGTQEYLELPYAQPQTIIVHDANKYELEKYTDNHYLFWISTWLQKQDHQPTASEEDGGVAWDGIGNITTANQFAWLISLINGENGQTADDFQNKTIVVNADLDLKAAIWVPITNFKGTLEGNGHVIQGLNSPLVKNDMGMFGTTNGATIQNVIAKVDFSGDAENIGTLIGTMNGGTLNNVEAAGDLEGKVHTQNMGGLVGKVESGSIHSSFSVNDMTTSASTTIMGGLVGTNGGDLYNSYANTTMSGATKIGGLVGVNDGHVENCYAVVGTQTFPAFANTNNGTIKICYADADNGYVTTSGDNANLSGHGTYDPVTDRKTIGYMYADNKVNASNDYVVSTIFYDNNHIDKWPGMLSSLNQWVKAKNAGYTPWFRPISQDLNGDLPVLAFPKDNCLGNQPTADGKMLRYSAYDLTDGTNFNNGLDDLLVAYKDQTATIFLYGNATKVEQVPTNNMNVTVNEDAVLLQKQGAKGAFINTTVGISFDNSYKKAVSTGDPSMPLTYDWHLMSTPLSNAPMGISWSEGQVNWWDTQDWDDAIGQVTGVSGSYLPDGTDAVSHWDFYTYYEPQYHWINFKRNSSSHAHYEEPHDWISYDNEANLVPGKGYMAAIDQDSYLSNTGTLNNGDVPIKLTYSNDGTGLEAPTKDWGSNLVGNPYQAYLDLNAVADGTGYTKFYIYSAETNQYVPFTIDQSSNTWTPSQFIHPHQAFFVLTDATDGNFKFTYDMATASKDENGNSYFRKGAQIDYPLINLFAKDEAGALNYTIIEVGRPELGGAEKTEALKTTDFDLYAHYGQIDYKLLFTPEEAQRVAVFFNTKKDGTYTLSWDTQNGEFSFLHLIDNITGVEVDMLDNDHYTFEGLASDYASRFYILFNNPNEEPGGNGNGNGNGEIAYFDGYGWIVNGEGILELIDVTGRVLYREYLAGDMNRIHLDNFKTGVYVLKLGDMTQKIIIK